MPMVAGNQIFFLPIHKIDKKNKHDVVLPTPMPDTFPFPFRRFCCLIIVEGDEEFWCGSGTLTTEGIITARHIFASHEDEPIKVWASFMLEGNEWITIDLEEVSRDDEENDITIFKSPVLSSFFVPVEIYDHDWKIKDFILEKENLYAFGCPFSLLGKVWRPRLVGISDTTIYTKGFAGPGISGGGIFAKKNDRFYVWAIHSGTYLPSWTLVSHIVRG